MLALYLILLSFNRFKDNYEHYILRGNDKDASDRDKRIGSTVAKVRISLVAIIFSDSS